MGAPPFSVRTSFFFSLSLYVTPQQINSSLILISQEITYLLYLTPLLSLSLFALTEHAHILRRALYSLTFCLSSLSLSAAHMHAYTQRHTHTLANTQ